MNQKLLITPVITPGGIHEEEDLIEKYPNGQIEMPSAENTMKSVQLHNGAPEHFHVACARLLSMFAGKANAVLVGGTTGE